MLLAGIALVLWMELFNGTAYLQLKYNIDLVYRVSENQWEVVGQECSKPVGRESEVVGRMYTTIRSEIDTVYKRRSEINTDL